MNISKKTSCFLSLIFLFALFSFQTCRAGMFDVSVTDEQNMGKEVADSVIDQYGVVDNKAEVDRLVSVGSALVEAASAAKDFEYHFYIVDTDMVNAFALPGGYIFVTKGMMDFVDDDDELAAVIGHEIVHIVHRHGVVLYKKSMKTMVMNLLLLLMTKDPNVVIANEMYQQGRSELFGRKAELEADDVEMEYLQDSGYDPTAQVRLMQKLEKLEMHTPPLFEGYFEVHPPTADRVNIIENHLRKNNIEIPDKKPVETDFRTFVKESCATSDTCPSSVMSGSTELFRFTATDDKLTPYQRAKDASVALNSLLDNGFQIYDIKTKTNGDQPELWIADDFVAKVMPGDAESAGKSTDALAGIWAQNIKNLLWLGTIKNGI